MVFPDLKKSIVKILSGTDRGTGFLISQDGLVLTCAHVIANSESIKVNLLDDNKEFTTLQTTAKEIFRLEPTEGDVSLIQLDLTQVPDYQIIPLKLVTAQYSQKHPFETFGFPDYAKTNGISIEGKIINTDNRSQAGIPRIVLDGANAVDFGVSGAPIFDTSFQGVIGIIDGKTPDRPRGANIAVGITTNFMSEKNAQIQLSEIPQKTYHTSQVLSRASNLAQIIDGVEKLIATFPEIKKNSLQRKMNRLNKRHAKLHKQLELLEKDWEIEMDSVRKSGFEDRIEAKEEEIIEIEGKIAELKTEIENL